jgi:hypothetical protein
MTVTIEKSRTIASIEIPNKPRVTIQRTGGFARMYEHSISKTETDVCIDVNPLLYEKPITVRLGAKKETFAYPGINIHCTEDLDFSVSIGALCITSKKLL